MPFTYHPYEFVGEHWTSFVSDLKLGNTMLIYPTGLFGSGARYGNVYFEKVVKLRHGELYLGGRSNNSSRIGTVAVPQMMSTNFTTAAINNSSSSVTTTDLYTHAATYNGWGGAQVNTATNFNFNGTYSGTSYTTISDSVTYALFPAVEAFQEYTLENGGNGHVNLTAKFSTTKSFASCYYKIDNGNWQALKQTEFTFPLNSVELPDILSGGIHTIRFTAKSTDGTLLLEGTGTVDVAYSSQISTFSAVDTIVSGTETGTISIGISNFIAEMYYSATFYCHAFSMSFNPTNAVSTATMTSSQLASYKSVFTNGEFYQDAHMELYTYSDAARTTLIGTDTLYLDAVAFCTPSLLVPTFASQTVDHIVFETALASKLGTRAIVQNLTSLQVTVPAATAKLGRTISAYSISFGGYSGTNTNRSRVFVIPASKVTPGDYQEMTVTVKDLYGYTAEFSETLYVTPYSKPTITTATIHRQNEVEATVILEFEGAFSSVKINGVEKNTLNAGSYKITKIDGTVVTDWTALSSSGFSVSGTDYSFEETELASLSPDESFRISFYAKDDLGTQSVAEEAVLNEGIPLLSFRKRDTDYNFPRIGIRTNNPTETLDINGNLRITGQIKKVIPQLSNVNPDDITSPGIYFLSYNASYSFPENKSILMTVNQVELSGGGTMIIQTAFTAENQSSFDVHEYGRLRNSSGTWTGWARV